jgi:hypothetical protein
LVIEIGKQLPGFTPTLIKRGLVNIPEQAMEELKTLSSRAWVMAASAGVSKAAIEAARRQAKENRIRGCILLLDSRRSESDCSVYPLNLMLFEF